jgi:hypothetical protein
MSSRQKSKLSNFNLEDKLNIKEEDEEMVNICDYKINKNAFVFSSDEDE